MVVDQEPPVATSEPLQPLRVVHTSGRPEDDPRRDIPTLGFRDYWYPVVALRGIPKHRPLNITLLGDELCVFRGADGPAVVSDFCPHRGARLSGGVCNYAGTVSCPYHGWTFDGKGECVAALSEGPNSAMPGKVRVRTYPSRVIKGVVFAWMGEIGPTPPESDLPPELFDDDSVIFSNTELWKANWRPALENLNDSHVMYTHRNSVQVLLGGLSKISFKGAKPVIVGSGVTLTYYTDDTLAERPYQEYFSGVKGLWPKYRFRLPWVRLFKLRPLAWIPNIGKGVYQEAAALPYNVGSRSFELEWNQGPNMPGMQRINFGGTFFTRWCVPIDEDNTRIFYLYATRPSSTRERLWLRLVKSPICFRALHDHNLGLQDGKILEKTRYDLTERFSAFDIETVAWRKLAILSARYGGRHDLIPADVLAKLNGAAIEQARNVSPQNAPNTGTSEKRTTVRPDPPPTSNA